MEMLAEIKKGQEKMEQKMEAGQDKLREEMKAGQDEMKTIQEELKEKIEAGQDKLEKKIEAGQVEMREEMVEMKTVLEERFTNVEKRVDEVDEKIEQFDAKIEQVQQGVGVKIQEVQEATDAAIVNVREEIKEEMERRFQQIGLEDITKGELPIVTIPRQGAAAALPASNIKPSTFDGKTSWGVYKTQFDLIASANGWDDRAKAYHLAASLRGEAADILQAVPENRRADLTSLVSALEMRFGEHHLKDYCKVQLTTRRQKPGESLQELASDVERLSLLAFCDVPSEVRDSLALQYFVEAIRDPDIQEPVRMTDCKTLKSALMYAMKVEAARHASRRDKRPVRAAVMEDSSEGLQKIIEKLDRLLTSKSQVPAEQKTRKIVCWTCGKVGHVRSSCPQRQRPTEKEQLN